LAQLLVNQHNGMYLQKKFVTLPYNIKVDPDEMIVNMPYKIHSKTETWKIVKHDANTILLSKLDLSKIRDKEIARKLPKAPSNKQEEYQVMIN
jgi:hypothetical protein